MQVQEIDLNTIVLKKKEEKRIEDLFNQFSKADLGFMNFSEFLQFILERNIINNKISFKQFDEHFKMTTGMQVKQQKQEEEQQNRMKKQSMTRNSRKQEIDKQDSIMNQNIDNNSNNKCLDKNKFSYIIVLLSKVIYGGDKNRLERMFNEILVERMINKKHEDNNENIRPVQFDDTNKKVLTEPVIKVLGDYEQELQIIFSLYYMENLKRRKLMLSWRELQLQNKRLATFGVIKYLKEIDIIPNLISIEQFEEMMLRILPAYGVKEHQFYNGNKIRYMYEHNIDKDSDPHIEGDPKFSFHELQMLLARIAIDVFPKDQMDKKMNYDVPILQFFRDHLYLRSNEEIRTKKGLIDINKPFIKYLKGLILDGVIQTEDSTRRRQQQDKTVKYEDKQDDEVANVIEYQNRKQYLINIVQTVDYQEAYNHINRELPQIPDKIEIVKGVIVGQEIKPLIIGQQLPKPPADKTQKQNKQSKKAGGKKDQIDFKKINWEGIPDDFPKPSYEFQKNHQQSIICQNPLVSGFQRASLSQIEVGPCLIKEILYPFNLVEEVRPYIEAAIIAHNQCNYIFALENYQSARKEWMKVLKRQELSEHIQIYFEFVEAQVFESMAEDQTAFYKYYQCKILQEKLNNNNPDRVLSYCGMGYSLFNMEQYDLATRCFIKAKKEREILIGEDTVDTASVYNNLGCCLMVLNRNREALAYLQLAQAILSAELGPYHLRSLTAARNITKCEKKSLEFQPEFAVPWAAYIEDQYKKVKKKKKKKK